jgi:hypothetical protein
MCPHTTIYVCSYDYKPPISILLSAEKYNYGIGTRGAESLAGVLGQFAAMAHLDLCNAFHKEGGESDPTPNGYIAS